MEASKICAYSGRSQGVQHAWRILEAASLALTETVNNAFTLPGSHWRDGQGIHSFSH